MTLLLLARHGETDWNRDGRFQGHATTRLNEVGRVQSRALAEQLDGMELSAIYSSDLPRALETAEIVAASKGMEVLLEPALREIDVGSWQGCTQVELEHAEWDGETYEQHRERVLAAVRQIAALHAGGQVLLVTHGGSLRRVQEAALGEALPVLANCDLYRLRFEGGVLRPLD